MGGGENDKEVKGMVKYNLELVLPKGRLEELLDRITQAQETIRESYRELEAMGYVRITEEAADGEAGGREAHCFARD